MKRYKAILHTAGKTAEELNREDQANYSEEETNIMITYLNAWEGVTVFLIEGIKPGGYVLSGWPEEEESKAKEAIYLMEQDSVFGCYTDAREEFDEVWEAGEYEPFASIGFNQEEVEIIEEWEE